ncbi:MAG TPA: hemolysin family protein [Solirubrobacterales bacterium]|jgi:CBS domain containing-hemolysin-like protein|nr:hemolysin family protein [Solirubrobacterales bacterium]
MTALLIAVSLLLVVINGFFVAAEFALVRAKASHLEQDVQENGSRRSKKALEAIRQIDSTLSACQLGITIASIGLGFAGEPAFGHLLKPLFEDIFGEGAGVAASVFVAFLLITILHIVIGELAPKSIAIATPEQTARWVAQPLSVFRRAFSPFISVLNGTANRLVGLFGIRPASEMELGATGDDLRMLVEHGRSRKTLDAGEAHMLSGVFELHENQARNVMTPIPAVVTVDVDDTVEVALRRCISSGHTRLPVTEDQSPDRIKGVVHLSSLVRLTLNKREEGSIESAVRPTLIVPETKPLDDLLADLQRERMSMAVVVDEYGRTVGIVTVEDIVEEVVGEIDDETDSALSSVRRLANGDLFVRGHVPLVDLEDHGIELPVDSDAYNSIGGYVFSELGRLPKRGDELRVNGYMIRVESVRENRVEAVRIREVAHGDTIETAAV